MAADLQRMLSEQRIDKAAQVRALLAAGLSGLPSRPRLAGVCSVLVAVRGAWGGGGTLPSSVTPEAGGQVAVPSGWVPGLRPGVRVWCRQEGAGRATMQQQACASPGPGVWAPRPGSRQVRSARPPLVADGASHYDLLWGQRDRKGALGDSCENVKPAPGPPP